jgi:hypothetical protein
MFKKILVFTGNFLLTAVKASILILLGTSQTSNKVVLLFILTTQCDIKPLLLPILDSDTFDVIDKLGKIQIQNLPFLFF